MKDFFAPAQFLELGDDEKLAAPSFEPMVAGIGIGGQDLQFPAGDEDILEDDTILFETILIDGEAPPAAPPAPVTAEFVTRYLPLGAVATSTLRTRRQRGTAVVPAKNELAAGRWTIASRDDGTAQETPDVAAGNATTFAATFQALTDAPPKTRRERGR